MACATSRAPISTAIVALVSTAIGYYIGSTQSKSFAAEEEQVEIKDGSPSGEPNKMVFVVRTDLGMQKGKIAAQCAHAAVACYEKAVERTPNNVISWKEQGETKIALKCSSLSDMDLIQLRAGAAGLITARIVDAGRTQIDPGSPTVVGIGPAPVSDINKITSKLALL